ncbi:50S ribosomal protein L18Ae [Pyrobaculum neutrophilum]|uniref:Large ribosomal subunit protein eL20 n=1 Tax=Pyrobaculum neutrophilum (strain DSM 2338 / JCM 9278 / NBRC 100436 / V24Sta) TaxID=444157 RepID=RL18A_PYRNV|nr:50S ribosomal protein L18Ae [Pyrobaculum neutrophilum]B1YAD4.1 RecName: Full=Large ribosomal subunit protein eL20; AltName: Full=50S ribosomal protein L18Ae; AltName: Full=50S ribosomal protein L20e; AltName: Full=50S ribosomal protein LX [Pyrobaculum neutrophilum V24Sta]ACB40583.1 Ribosomal LX protein [Pyrobaculum neutrophilum V24Sta]
MPRIYRVVGETATGMRFRVEVTAEKPYDAVEKVYSLIGSRHKLSRVQIKIREVAVVSPEEARSDAAKLLMAVDRVVRY